MRQSTIKTIVNDLIYSDGKKYKQIIQKKFGITLTTTIFKNKVVSIKLNVLVNIPKYAGWQAKLTVLEKDYDHKNPPTEAQWLQEGLNLRDNLSKGWIEEKINRAKKQLIKAEAIKNAPNIDFTNIKQTTVTTS